MEFRILGPLEVLVDGAPVALGGPKQRALLALLLLNANRVVSRDRLLDQLFEDGSAPQSDHALVVQVSRLRKALGAKSGDRIVPRAPGYLLKVEANELDLERFHELAGAGRCLLDEGRFAESAQVLREAESLWRGQPLADVDSKLFARLEVARLEEQRLSVLEDRVACELALNRHAPLVPELERLVAENPLRERLAEHLMLALYRAGRQADALEVYRGLRDHLSGELGLEPGPDVRRLQQAILRQDSELILSAAPSSPAERSAGAPPPAPGTRRIRRSRLLAAALLVVAAAAVAVAVSLASRSGSNSLEPLSGNGLGHVSADGRLVAEVRLPAAPTDVAAGYGSLWITEVNADSVVRVDPNRHVIVDTIRVGDGPDAIAAGSGDVWVVNTLDGSVSRIDPATDTVVQRIRVAGNPTAVAVAGGVIWVALHGAGTVVRIDATTGRPRGATKIGIAPTALAAAAGAIWETDDASGTVSRIDPATGTVDDTIHVGDAPSALAVTRSAVWVLNRLDSTVSRIDPTTDAVTATYAISGGPHGLAATESGVWVAQRDSGSLVRLDPGRGTAVRTTNVGKASGLVAFGEGQWVTIAAGGAFHRGGTLRIASVNVALDALDPASSQSPNVVPTEFLGLTNDGLVTLDHTAGPDGERLVPDLSVALPRPGDSGRRYAFRLRRGVAYSTGGSVRPSDVRRSFERLFEVHSSGASFFDSIAGAKACEHSRASCDLSPGIVADDRSMTVTFRLTRPDPDFLHKLTLPYAFVLPAATPHRISQSPLPATGPYELARYSRARSARLVRNPRFREWSAAAQPAGYPDQIDLRSDLGDERASALVAQEQADFAVNLGVISGGSRDYFLLHHPGRIHTNPVLITNFLFLNVRVPPFDDLRVRRALNLALDRTRVVAADGGRDVARPTCQILPPGLAGYEPYCPYTRLPTEAGTWQNPDLARARRLVAASGTRGMKVTVWDTREPQVSFLDGRFTVAALRSLGYRATERILPDRQYFDFTGDSRNKAQVVDGGWSADYPSADDFFGKLTCSGFVGANGAATTDDSEFCDPVFDREVQRAATLQLTDPPAANTLWARLDRELTDRAIWLPTTTPYETDLLSSRVGNYQYNPVWGPLIDQLWVR